MGNEDDAYALAQQWALRLWQAGFSGIYYGARRDVELQSRSVALFGKPGDEGESAVLSTLRPLNEIAAEMADHYGFVIVTGLPL